jgi:hypothetical protein
LPANGHTERSITRLLEERYTGKAANSGNGPAWAWVPQVRNAAGFDARRTCDGIAMSLWPSRGLELHGHEIKCSRSDWLMELRDPSKAEQFTVLCDRWWLVTASKDIVKPGELPPGWGHMAVNSAGKLVVVVQADLLVPGDMEIPPGADGALLQAIIKQHRASLPAKFNRSFLAALLRAAARTQAVQPAEVAQAVEAERQRLEQHHADNVERWREERDGLRARIRAFEEAAGVQLGHLPGEAPAWAHGHDVATVGKALRVVLNGEAQLDRFERRLATLVDTAEKLAADARAAMPTAPQ